MALLRGAINGHEAGLGSNGHYYMVDSRQFATDLQNLTLRINHDSGVISAVARRDSLDNELRLEYMKDADGDLVIKDGSWIEAFPSKSEKWVAVKSVATKIPWPCDMAIKPVHP